MGSMKVRPQSQSQFMQLKIPESTIVIWPEDIEFTEQTDNTGHMVTKNHIIDDVSLWGG